MAKRVHITSRTPYETAAGETSSAFTLYVRSTGADTNDGLSSGNALLTIQAAINKIPNVVNHKVTVDIGAGTFAGFLLQNKKMGVWSGMPTTDRTIIIQGAGYVAATLASGNVTGTVEAGTARTIDDTTGEGWTAHDLRGRILYVNSAYYVIRDNTTTQIEIAGTNGSSMSGTYAIKDYATVIQETAGGVSGGIHAGIRIVNCSGVRTAYSAIYLNQFQVKPSSATQGTPLTAIMALNSDVWLNYVGVDCANNTTAGGSAFMLGNSNDVRVENCSAGNSAGQGFLMQNIKYLRTFSNSVAYANSSFGVNFLTVAFVSTTDNVYADSGLNDGFVVQCAGQITGSNWFAKSNTSGVGLWVGYGTGYCSLTGGNFSSNKYGIQVGHNRPDSANYQYEDSCDSFRLYGTVTVSSNSNAGVCIEGGARARFTSLVGTGNGTYGLIARRGAHVTVTSGTTVTGTSGDILFNGTAATYATHFAADGDSITDPTDGTSLIRTDAA